ncbi:ankyrin [bacterium]|nr:ankyrin [bacterium]
MKDVNSLPGIHALRTMFSAKKRSMPKVHSSAYLDLFMLNKEKDRLMKEAERLSQRDAVVKKRIEEVDEEINKLQGAEAAVRASSDTNFQGRATTQKDGTQKEWKKMALNY